MTRWTMARRALCLPILLPLLGLGRIPPASPTEGTARSSDGLAIRYHAEGHGEPALVFVHCWGCDRHFWDASIGHFAARHRVVALDLAGHGDSDRGRKEWTIEAYAEDVRSVVEAQGLRQVVLIGHSMGGPVVLEAARRLKGRVVGVVPVDTLLNVDEPNTPEEKEKFLAEFRKDFPGTTKRFVAGAMFTPQSDPRVVERVVTKLSAQSPEIGIASLEHLFAYDAPSALKETLVPICAVNADKYPTKLDAARRYAPQFDAVIMPGVGHFLMLEDPPGFNARLLEALGRVLAKR